MLFETIKAYIERIEFRAPFLTSSIIRPDKFHMWIVNNLKSYLGKDKTLPSRKSRLSTNIRVVPQNVSTINHW